MFLPRFPTLLALCLSRKKNNSRLQFADELLKAEPQHESGGGGGARNANTLCGKKTSERYDHSCQNHTKRCLTEGRHPTPFKKIYLNHIVAYFFLEQSVIWYGWIFICRDERGSCLKSIREGHGFFLRKCVIHIRNSLSFYPVCVYTNSSYFLSGKFFRWA